MLGEEQVAMCMRCGKDITVCWGIHLTTVERQVSAP